MREVGAAITAGLRAPLARWRLVLVLWLARLLPAALFFALPVHAAALERLEDHPDAARLLDPASDDTGFAYAAQDDLLRSVDGLPDRVFWLALFTWLLVTVLAGGLVARLVHGEGASGLFLAECGRYACRFLRLGLLAAALLYAADILVNGVLAEIHEEAEKRWHVQDFAIEKAFVRGALFLALWQVLGAVHSYARIDLVAFERRSAFLSFLRGLGTLAARLPQLLLLELGMLVAAGAAALLAWLLARVALPPRADSTWLSLGFFLGAAALGSYLRSGVELGTLEARCRLLAPLHPLVSPSEEEESPQESQDETPPAAA